jgi:hypothetical protein
MQKSFNGIGMFRHGGYFFTLTLTIAGLAAICCPSAQAAESRSAPWTIDPLESNWQAVDHCAVYGPDFASVAGSDTCVRIGGRVRVEYHFRQSSEDAGPSWAANRPATMRSDAPSLPTDEMIQGIEQGHLRVQSLGVSTDPLR